MYRVLIMDDEEPSRDAIRILGEWSQCGFGEVLEAANGMEGLQLVRELKPDLVFVDMKMPVMNGVEFLQMMEEVNPDILIIVISGYDDFEFTRQAIKSRVLDYLLKPVNRKALNQALHKAAETIRDRSKRLHDSIERDIALNMSLPKLKENTFLSILDHNGVDQVDRSQLKLIDPDHQTKSFRTAVIHILNLEAVKRDRFKQDAALLRFAVTNLINEISSEAFQCFSFGNPKKEKEIIAVLSCDESQERELDQEDQELELERLAVYFMEKVSRKLRELFGIKSVTGIGSTAPDMNRLARSYRSAEAILESVNLIGIKEGAVYHTPQGTEDADNLSVINRIMLIRGALQGDHYSLVPGIIGEYVKAIRSSGYFSMGSMNRTLQEFWILMHDIALELGVPRGDLAQDCREMLHKHGLFFDVAEFGDFERLLQHIGDYFCGMIRERASKRSGAFHIQDIRDYVRSHYFEDIKISMFTEKYYLSREYLMRLFKQEYGYGIYEYVLRLRMEKAQELLADPNMKIQHISDMLGYKDKNYFSKAFKNFYGMSPSDYRLQKQRN